MPVSNWSNVVVAAPTAAAAPANPIFVTVRVFINNSSTATVNKRVNLRDFTDNTMKFHVGRTAHRIEVEISQFDSASAYRLKGISMFGFATRKVPR